MMDILIATLIVIAALSTGGLVLVEAKYRKLIDKHSRLVGLHQECNRLRDTLVRVRKQRDEAHQELMNIEYAHEWEMDNEEQGE